MMKVYLKTKTGADAIGLFDKSTKGLIVLKGSKVSDKICSSPRFAGKHSIENRRLSTTENSIVTKDISFKSCSTAANFVTGCSSNGYKAWKDKSGKSIKVLMDNEV